MTSLGGFKTTITFLFHASPNEIAGFQQGAAGKEQKGTQDISRSTFIHCRTFPEHIHHTECLLVTKLNQLDIHRKYCGHYNFERS